MQGHIQRTTGDALRSVDLFQKADLINEDCFDFVQLFKGIETQILSNWVL